MKTFWLYCHSKDGLWDGVEDSEWEKLRGEVVIAGKTHLVEAKNLAEALSTVVSVEEVIRRVFADVQEFGNEYAHEKWFDENKWSSNYGIASGKV